VITMDWTATMIAAAGARPHPNYPLDGEDQLAILSGRESVADRTFFWRIRSQGAMRSGKWKFGRSGTTELLFDLSVDEHEQADFGQAQPQVLERLRREFNIWEAAMMKYPAAGS